MVRVWLRMVRKDLLRQARQPLGLLVVLAFPVVFSLLLAAAFGRAGEVRPRVDLLVEDRDDTVVSGLLVAALTGGQLGDYAQVTEVGEEGRARMERGEASALLGIPPGFAENLLAGRPVALELVRNPAQGILPEIAEQMFSVGVDVLDAGSHVLSAPLEELAPLLDGPDAPSESEVLRLSSTVYALVDRAGPMLSPPLIDFEVVRVRDEDVRNDPAGGGSIFLFVLPGISVWALFALGDLTMRDVLREGLAGTLRRQLVAPLHVRDIIVGKALLTAVVATASVAILATVGATVLDRAVDVLAFLVVSAAVVAAVTGFAALIYGLARNERQGATVASIVTLFFAFLGGSFVPLGSMPDAVRNVAPLSLFYWGVSAYNRILHEGAQLAELWGNVAVLAALGAGMLLLGARFLAARVRAGATA